MSNAHSNTYHHSTAPRFSLTGIAAIVAAHLALLVLLASLQVIPLPTALAPLMVQIVQSAATPTPEISPPRPKPPERKVTPQPLQKPVPRQQPQMIAAQTQATSSESSAPVINNSQAPPTSLHTATVTQARFDADYLQNPAPSYPALSRRMGEEGKVILRVQVEANGRPGQIEVRSSSGSPRLDQSALDAVARWKFIPAKRGDETVSAWVLVPIVFNLKS